MKYTPEEMEAKGWLDDPIKEGELASFTQNKPEQVIYPKKQPENPQKPPYQPEKAIEPIVPKPSLHTKPKSALKLFKQENQEIEKLKKQIKIQKEIIESLILKRLE